MMLIINDSLRIVKQKENVVLQVKRTGKNISKESWKNAGYFNNLKFALLYAFSVATTNMLEENHTIHSIIKRLNEIEKEIFNAVQ